MKKRGVALAIVLIVGSVLLILCTAISSAVINTTKLNKRYSENIDLELAAKSGLNLVKEDFITRVNKKEIKTLDNIKEYIEKINSISDEFSANIKSTDFQEIKNFLNEYLNEDIILDIKLQIKDSNKLEIQSVAEDKGHKNTNKEETQILVFNFNDSTVGDGNKPGSGESGGDNSGNDSGSTEGVLDFDKLFNIGNNINSFGNNNQNAMDKFQYGGPNCNVGQNNSLSNGQKPIEQNTELTTINNINISEILKRIAEYNSITPSSHLNPIIVKNGQKKYNELIGNSTDIELENSKVLFSSGGKNVGEKKITLKNSELIFGGNLTFDSGMVISESENSNFIVNGNLIVSNRDLEISKSKESVFVINGDLIQSGSAINIDLEDSIFIVAGKIEPQNNFKLNLKNSAFICLGDMNLNTDINVISNGKSFIYGKNFGCSSGINITINPPGGYKPDSPVVINAINSFLNVNKN